MTDTPPLTIPRACPAERAEMETFLEASGDLHTVEVVLADTNGVLRGKWLPGSALEKIYDGGVQLPFSLFGLDVWGREVEKTGLHIETGDKDASCRPVPGTLVSVPWANRPTAQVLLSCYDSEGGPFLADPRHVLARLMQRLAEKGLSATAAFELEFYLFDDENPEVAQPRPVFSTELGPARQNMYALADLEALQPLVDDIRAGADAQGIMADAAVSEAAPGQFEVNLHHRSDALAAADDAVLLRRLVQGVARKHGMKASFMAKPFNDWPGNGMHVHVSLDGTDGNIFADPETGEKALRHCVSGLLDTMPQAQALFISTFNGYRRMQPGSYAPTAICWGHDNRSVAVRVPSAEGKARRIEHRIAGADANPYLVLAGILAGMLAGLDNQKEPPAPVAGNAYEQEAFTELSPWMDEAIDAFERSALMKAALGTEMHKVFTAIKRDELAAFGREISQLERETYL